MYFSYALGSSDKKDSTCWYCVVYFNIKWNSHDPLKVFLYGHRKLSTIINKNLLQATLSYIPSSNRFPMTNWTVLPVHILLPSSGPIRTYTPILFTLHLLYCITCRFCLQFIANPNSFFRILCKYLSLNVGKCYFE